MKNAAATTHSLLLKKRKTLAVAESCTGGLLSSVITRNPGSSNYFILGVVVYSNAAKTKVLGIPKALIAKKGAVSKEVAMLLAHKVRKIAKSDFGIGITGIAGPGKARADKPIGTVYIAIASAKRAQCRKLGFSGTRLTIQKKSTIAALKLLNSYL
jgi:nicotinamide-nucleotide amidase